MAPHESMTTTAIRGGELYTPTTSLSGGVVLIEEGRIRAVGDGSQIEIPRHAEVIDATGLIVAPGLIDLHTHGLLGHDVMGPGLAGAITAYPQFGVTSFLATTLTARPNRTLEALRTMADILRTPPSGARCCGIHLEGPHLSRARAGAHNRELFHPLDWPELERLQSAASGQIQMITLAPELAGHFDLIPRLIDHGIEPSLGHSDATYAQAMRAYECGLRHASHTFNAMRGFHHRQPGAVGAVLYCEEMYAQVVADGVHVHPAALQLLLRVKGIEHVLLVSDSSPFACLPEGDYDWSGLPVTMRNNKIETSAGRLAGANALLDQGLRTLIQQCGLSLHEALTCATRTPAAAMGWNKKGRLAPGMDADIVLLDGELSPVMTLVAGAPVWTRPDLHG